MDQEHPDLRRLSPGLQAGWVQRQVAGRRWRGRFQPESDDDFYVGVKNDFRLAGRPLRINVEGYWDLYHNKQVSYLTLAGIPGAIPTLATVTVNVPATTYRGFDADIAYELTDWLRLSLIYSCIDAYNTSWPDFDILEFRAAHGQCPSRPEEQPGLFRFAEQVQLHGPFPHPTAGRQGRNRFRPDVQLPGQVLHHRQRLPAAARRDVLAGRVTALQRSGPGRTLIPSYSLTDLRFEWNHVWGSNINAAANVTNVFNKVYTTGNTGTLAFGVQAIPTARRGCSSFELSTKF